MTPDFFEFSNKSIGSLNQNERKLFDYVVKNIHAIPPMSIRTLAEHCFVSTTTVIRFVKKLGFSGYRAFVESIRQSLATLPEHQIPSVFHRRAYSEEYLKNVIESVRVVSQRQLEEFCRVMSGRPAVYIYAHGLSSEAARYAHYLFSVAGVVCILCLEDYQIKASLLQIRPKDVALALSFTGENPKTIRVLEQINSLCRPYILSITRAGNNMIQNLSDLNFYVFSDQLSLHGVDITSRISMIAILETMLYAYFTAGDVTKNTKK